MHTWRWQTWNGFPYLTCSLLEAFPHGFFTQQFAPRLPAELVQVLHPEAPAYRAHQVHGNGVVSPSEVEAIAAQTTSPEESGLAQADGLLTERSHQSVWVCSADCTPALVADCQTGQVAAVHAGWRGTAQKVLPETIARLLAQGSQLTDLRVALGPAIAGEVYQVSSTVAAEVVSSVIPIDGNDLESALTDLIQQAGSPVGTDPEPGRMRLDVRRVNVLQLEQLGLTPEQIAVSPHCTFQQPEYFFSYRRDRRKNVQWSGIVSTDGSDARLSA